MDKKYLLLGAAFVVLMVAFGNNPVQTPKETVNDPFSKSLKDTLDKKTRTGIGAGAGGSSILQDLLPGTAGQNTQPGGMPGSTVPVPGMPQQGMALPPGQVQPYGGLPPGSYPPGGPQFKGNTFDPKPDWAIQQQAQVLPNYGGDSPLPAEQVPSFYLKDGRRVFFSGFKVFLLSKDGSLRAMPDGRYPLQSGDTIVIKNGRRVADEP